MDTPSVAGLRSVEQVMSELAPTRPVFHAEADLQHAFAWSLRNHCPELEVRLERRVLDRAHLDLWIRDPRTSSSTAVELKYLCAGLDVVVAGERFSLPNQGAQDIRGYDVLHDVSRVEQMVAAGVATSGLVLVLTNDPAYWSRPSHGRATGAAHFRLYEGEVVSGTRTWGEQSAGTQKHRPDPVELVGSYRLTWSDYSQPTPEPRGTFRYLAIKVPPAGA